MSETYTVLCGKCHCPAESGGEEHGEANVFCPKCGRVDDLGKARREAEEHVAYVMEKKFAASINRRKPSGGIIKITTKATVAHRTFRWISDYKG